MQHLTREIVMKEERKIPEQHQPQQPGVESEMTPQPDSLLKDTKVAVSSDPELRLSPAGIAVSDALY